MDGSATSIPILKELERREIIRKRYETIFYDYLPTFRYLYQYDTCNTLDIRTFTSSTFFVNNNSDNNNNDNNNSNTNTRESILLLRHMNDNENGLKAETLMTETET